jgi:hypothetical protein
MPRRGRKCPVFTEVSEASAALKWPEMFRQSSVIPGARARSTRRAPPGREESAGARSRAAPAPGVSEPPASLCRCSGRAFRAVSSADGCAVLPHDARQRSSPAHWRRPPRSPARPPWPGWRRWSREGWCSTLVAGCAWPRAAVSALGQRCRFDGCSAGWGRGVAAPSLARLGWARGFRQHRDHPERHRLCDRDQNAHVRRTPPGPRAGHGRVALLASPALVPRGGVPGAVRGACPRVGGGRGWGSRGVAGPAGAGAQSQRRNVTSAAVPGDVGLAASAGPGTQPVPGC